MRRKKEQILYSSDQLFSILKIYMQIKKVFVQLMNRYLNNKKKS